MNLLLPLWFGFWRRFYGANKNPWFPSAENRIAGYSLPLAMATFLMFPLDDYAIYQAAYMAALCMAFWAGISMVKYAKYWEVKTAKDWLMMALNGLLLTAPMGIVLGVIQSSALVGLICGMSGILIAPGYWLGWKMPTLNKTFLNKGTEWGEVLGHILIGLVFAGVKSLCPQ